MSGWTKGPAVSLAVLVAAALVIASCDPSFEDPTGTGGGNGNGPDNPVPSLTDITPDIAMAGSDEITLVLNGGNFVTESQVRWGGTGRPTTYVSSSQLRATISAADLLVGDSAQVTVFNPEPGGGVSGALMFMINNPSPTAASLSRDTASVGAPAFNLTVTGSDFVGGAVARWNGTDRATTSSITSRSTWCAPSSRRAMTAPRSC